MEEPTWVEPKQARSRQRFQHILKVAETLFAEEGYELVSTNQIAEKAGVSIGALYRFFPNKEAILHALVRRYQLRMGRIFPVRLNPNRPFSEVIDILVNQLMRFDDHDPGFTHVFVHVEEEIAHIMHHEVHRQVKRLIGTYFPHFTDEQLSVCSTAGFGIVRGMLPLKSSPIGQPVDVVAEELKASLLAYIYSFDERHHGR